MSDTVSLSDEELGALFGEAKADRTIDDAAMKSELSILQDALTSSVAKVKSSLSSKLGEEVECSVSDLEIINGLQTEKTGKFYVVDGNFSNNGSCEHYFVYPAEVALQFAKSYSGLTDISDALDEIRPHIYEITESILQEIASELSNGFFSQLNEVTESNNLIEINSDSKFIRLVWTVGEIQFYEFFSFSILNLLQSQSANIAETEEEKKNDLTDNLLGEEEGLDDVSEIFGADTESQGGQPGLGTGLSSLLGTTDSSESIASLGEELLKDSVNVSNVALPELNDAAVKTGDSSKDIKMLLGVSMEVTVELGKTRMKLEEILDINRGSIIELRKLAGEPLDVKVNNKLIAKGEVVVIDENFGIRIIEITTPNDRIKDMN